MIITMMIMVTTTMMMDYDDDDDKNNDDDVSNCGVGSDGGRVGASQVALGARFRSYYTRHAIPSKMMMMAMAKLFIAQT